MGYGWLFGLLLIVLAVLAIAALFKYLRRQVRRRRASPLRPPADIRVASLET